jgi:hypothetical protein
MMIRGFDIISRNSAIWTKPSDRSHSNSSHSIRRFEERNIRPFPHRGTITLNYLAKNDLVDVKRLCIDWYLPHQTSMIIRQLCEIRIQQLSPQNWYFSEMFTFQHINRRQHQIWRYHRNVVNESTPEDMIIVEDN